MPRFLDYARNDRNKAIPRRKTISPPFGFTFAQHDIYKAVIPPRQRRYEPKAKSRSVRNEVTE